MKSLKFEDAIGTSAIKIKKVEIRVTKKRVFCYHGTLVKNMVSLGILAKIMVSLYTILHGHGILAMPRTWQDRGKASKEVAMDLDKDIMASKTGPLLEAFGV